MSYSTLYSSDTSDDEDRRHTSFLLQVIDDTTRRKNDHKITMQIEQELYCCDDENFRQHFGLNRHQFHKLTSMLHNRIKWCHTKFPSLKNLRPRDRIAISLRFLATGRSFGDLSIHYKIPDDVVRTIVLEVCETIRRYLGPIVMPKDCEENWLTIARQFKYIYDLPNCVGAMNIFQVNAVDETILDVLAVVDANHRIIKIDVGKYGLSRNVSTALTNSKLGRSFLNNRFGVPADRPVEGYSDPIPYVLIGDETFPSKPYLMPLYDKSQSKREVHHIFNGRIAAAAETARETMIDLCKRWQIFDQAFPVPRSEVLGIITTACCLHNYFHFHSPSPMNRDVRYPTVTRRRLHSLRATIPDESLDIVRYKYHKYFLSSQGHVPWQWIHTRRPRTYRQ